MALCLYTTTCVLFLVLPHPSNIEFIGSRVHKIAIESSASVVTFRWVDVLWCMFLKTLSSKNPIS